MKKHSTSKPIKHHIFKSWLNRHLSSRIKRYFFITSLWAYFNEDTNYDKETLRKLNIVMSLGSTEDALFIPALMNKVIWKDNITQNQIPLELLMEKDIETKTGNLLQALDNIPKWLVYDKREVIEEDIRNLALLM